MSDDFYCYHILDSEGDKVICKCDNEETATMICQLLNDNNK